MAIKRIQINVSGSIYETTNQCIERYPNTLLGDPVKRNKYFIATENMYFFDRHRLAFEGILMYYQSFGRIICPENVPDQVFQTELEFFNIDCEFLRSAQEARKYVLDKVAPYPTSTIQKRIWKIMQSPASSKGAQVISSVSLFMTIVSIILACYTPGEKNKQVYGIKLFPFEAVCFVWFTLEYSLRFWASPCRKTFLQSWIDLTDLITLIIFYTSLALTSSQASSTSVLRIFRLANAFRVFRLTRFSNGLRLLIYTIYTSKTDLQLLAGFLGFFIIISGSMVYFAETSYNSMFQTGGIFDGIWFSLISCTTVGYGDVFPVTIAGKIITALTITFGAMFVLLPVLKLVNSFSNALEVTRSVLNDSENTIETKMHTAKRKTIVKTPSRISINSKEV